MFTKRRFLANCYERVYISVTKAEKKPPFFRTKCRQDKTILVKMMTHDHRSQQNNYDLQLNVQCTIKNFQVVTDSGGENAFEKKTQLTSLLMKIVPKLCFSCEIRVNFTLHDQLGLHRRSIGESSSVFLLLRKYIFCHVIFCGMRKTLLIFNPLILI